MVEAKEDLPATIKEEMTTETMEAMIGIMVMALIEGHREVMSLEAKGSSKSEEDKDSIIDEIKTSFKILSGGIETDQKEPIALVLLEIPTTTKICWNRLQGKINR